MKGDMGRYSYSWGCAGEKKLPIFFFSPGPKGKGPVIVQRRTGKRGGKTSLCEE